MYKVKVNFDDESAPNWAKNFSQKEDFANLLIFGTFRANRYNMWLKNRHLLASWEYDRVFSFESNGDVVFSWNSEGEHAFFVLAWC